MRRFFANNNDLIDENHVKISGNEHNHLVNVLRMKENTEIEICFNDEYIWLGKILKIEKKQSVVHLISKKLSTSESSIELNVYMALSKGDKMEFVLQKITELGASKFTPFESQFTVLKIKDSKKEKYEKIAVEACKQCGRAKVTEVIEALTFNQMCCDLKNNEVVIFANEKEKLNFIKADMFKPGIKKIAIIVGSEGGFADNEIEKIIANGGTSITLGNRILRCETAAICVTSCVMLLCNGF